MKNQSDQGFPSLLFQQAYYHTLYPGCNIFVYIADQKQPNTSRARMDCGKLTLFLLLQTLKRGVASQDFAEKHCVPAFMFRHKKYFKKDPFASEMICFSLEYSTKDTNIGYTC